MIVKQTRQMLKDTVMILVVVKLQELRMLELLQMADDDPTTFAIPEGANLEVPEIKYEYLDHTADVQLHAWGTNLQEAFENVAAAMFGYMTDIETVDMEVALEIEAEGDDVDGLLFHFLDEFLFSFSAEPFFIPRKIEILSFDLENFKIKARGYGEPFDISKHPQGTEVKAITYGSMKVYNDEEKGQHELFVIIDI